MPTNIQTEPDLLRRLGEAAGQPMSADELRAQRMSFIMGNLSKESSVTREQVVEVLKQLEGSDDE